ncbi:MAG: OsmC family protein [Anaerolineales bacterium]|jgi:putative redox protein
MAAEKRALTVRWKGGHGFEAANPEGATVRFGSAHEEAALSPVELLLASLAGCSGTDVVDILAKKRQAVSGLEIRVEGMRAANPPRVYTSIHLEYVVRGTGLTQHGVAQAISLSRNKYCSVAQMLDKTAEIQTSFRIETEPGEESRPQPPSK